jgi:hypothetical protein
MLKLESVESDRMRAGDREVANSPNSAAQNVIPMYKLKWTHAEKTVARRAFDLALGKELEALLQEAKDRVARIEEPSELWDLESWVTERRREIDRRYDRPQLHVGSKKARLGSQSRLPGMMIGFIGSIKRTAAVAYYLPAHRRRCPLQPSGYLPNRRTGSNAS